MRERRPSQRVRARLHAPNPSCPGIPDQEATVPDRTSLRAGARSQLAHSTSMPSVARGPLFNRPRARYSDNGPFLGVTGALLVPHEESGVVEAKLGEIGCGTKKGRIHGPAHLCPRLVLRKDLYRPRGCLYRPRLEPRRRCGTGGEPHSYRSSGSGARKAPRTARGRGPEKVPPSRSPCSAWVGRGCSRGRTASRTSRNGALSVLSVRRHGRTSLDPRSAPR